MVYQRSDFTGPKPEKWWLCQDAYVDKISSLSLREFEKFDDTHAGGRMSYEGKRLPRRSMLTSERSDFLYAATITRAGVVFTAAKLPGFLQNLSPYHHGAVNRALSYLNGTQTLAIGFKISLNLERVFLGVADASFADDSVTRRSTEGCLFRLFGGSIDWRSTKQKTVAISSTEAELLALLHEAKGISWWGCFFQGVSFHPGNDLRLQCDNQKMI